MKNPNSIFFILALAATFLVSCTFDEQKDVVAGSAKVIAPDSIVNIITEIHLAEAMLREMKTDLKQKEKTAEGLYAEIFKKHAITREQYEKSIEYYQQHLDEYQDIYERVITLLSQKQSENSADK